MINRDELRKMVRRTLGDDPRILAVYLHGSAAHGTMRPDSDVDLAILLHPNAKMAPLERQALANRLSYGLGRDADLGEVSSHNLVFAAEVLFTGELLYTNDAEATALRSTALLGLYIQFNHDRREVLDAYRA